MTLWLANVIQLYVTQVLSVKLELRFSIFSTINDKVNYYSFIINILPPSHNISKKNTFYLSQNINKKDKFLSFPRFFLFILIKLNANYFQFSLSFIFSITNGQWKLFLHLPIKLFPKKTQKTILQILML